MTMTSRSRWKKLVADVVKLRPKQEPQPLQTYWAIGDKAITLDGPYGNGQICEFAKEVGWGYVMVYACLRFRTLWPEKADLERVEGRGLLFSHIKELSHGRLTPKQRERLERFVEKERPSVRELRAKVRKLIEGQPRPKKRSRRYKDLGDI